MEKAPNGDIALPFMDASHFVIGCDLLGYSYGKVRKFILTFSGRMRYNVLGTIDFIAPKVLTVTNDKYITATEICEMPEKISKEYKGEITYLVSDNARYQKCKVVQALAVKLNIHLVYIPPYSPNLNLIERLWKFIKGEFRTRYYDDFSLFKETINSDAPEKYKHKEGYDRWFISNGCIAERIMVGVEGQDTFLTTKALFVTGQSKVTKRRKQTKASQLKRRLLGGNNLKDGQEVVVSEKTQ